MCVIICTVRTVLWYIMSLAGTLLILISLLTQRWVDGRLSAVSLSSPENAVDAVSGLINNVINDEISGLDDMGKLVEKNLGLFGILKTCMETDQQKIFEGECFPSVEELKLIFMDLDDAKYPHAWRGAVLLFGLGLALMVITDLFALLTACCRSCICCSVFTICGSLQTFAGIFFALGLLAYPAGWGSQTVKNACADGSEPFVLGANCDIGVAFWIAVAGTVCTLLASSLAIFAYQSTRSSKCEQAQDEGEHCICLI